MVGHTISHFRITEKLGEGGMGLMYTPRTSELNAGNRKGSRVLPLRHPGGLSQTQAHRHGNVFASST